MHTKQAHINDLQAKVKELEKDLSDCDSQFSNQGNYIKGLEAELAHIKLDKTMTPDHKQYHDLTCENINLKGEVKKLEFHHNLSIERIKNLELELSELESDMLTK